MTNIISKAILFIIALGNTLLLPHSTFAQRYQLQSGISSFSVSAPAKTIYGESNQVAVQIDGKSGSLNLEVPVKSFQFTNNFIAETMNDLIHDRFNNYYMESDQYPKVIYKAQIVNISDIHFEKDGTYPIHTKGIATIHGVEQEVTAEGFVNVKNKKATVDAKMTVRPNHFKIRIPSYIGDMYFREVLIEVKGTLIRSADTL